MADISEVVVRGTRQDFGRRFSRADIVSSEPTLRTTGQTEHLLTRVSKEVRFACGIVSVQAGLHLDVSTIFTEAAETGPSE